MRGIVDHDPRKYDPLKNVARDEAIKQRRAKVNAVSTPSSAASPK